jgi:hypothetical protein
MTATDPPVSTSDSIAAAGERRIASFLRSAAPAAPPGLLDRALARLDPVSPVAGQTRLRRRFGGLLGAPEWLGLGITAVAIVVVGAGVLAFGAPGTRSGAGANGAVATAPSYEGIAFRADGLVIEAAGRRFTLDPSTAAVHSDPGDPTRRTLEWTWQQHGADMRLNLYLSNDGESWWVSGLRTYDGRLPARWAGIAGTLLEQPLGDPFVGPLDLVLPALDPGAGATRLQIDRLVLLPSFETLPVSATTGPVNGGDGGPIAAGDPFATGQLLHCIGAEAMTPRQLAFFARSKGYPVEYRYLSDGSSDKREPPPDSVLVDVMWGSSGQLVVMAAAPAEPQANQVRVTAERACPGGGSN